jgi:hypothetical protein
MRELLLAACLACVATGQSYFNMYGLGEVAPQADARPVGLGLPLALSIANPGVLVSLPQTSFTVSGITGGALGTQSGRSRLLGEARPTAFSAAVPLPWQTRLLVGLDEHFNQDFNVWSESTADTAYRRQVVGRGGIYGLNAGVAKSIAGSLCVGIEYSHLLGGSREDWRFALNNGAYSSTDTIEVVYAANTFRAGLSFQTRLFSLGCAYEPAVGLTATRFKRVHGVVSDSQQSYRLSLPATVSFAAGVSPSARIALVAAASIRPWQNATISHHDTTTSLGYSNVWRGSVGAEYELFPGYPVRLGLSHQDWYCSSADGLKIAENGVSLGTSLPVPKFGSLDAAGQVLFRSSGSLNEIAGRLMLTLSYHEEWARRSRRWGY